MLPVLLVGGRLTPYAFTGAGQPFICCQVQSSRLAAESLPEILDTPCPAVTLIAARSRMNGAGGEKELWLSWLHTKNWLITPATLLPDMCHWSGLANSKRLYYQFSVA
ncbi:jg2591 [Pararge aegeria aegeria]|uniref:Jg2591 protein n=1 Tax=Pararge aegeria aegeria TaxID=348720 RepID=A0A8S4QXY5_9NEOP|nr:jg2591 [Pararge aegeria aegeria]